MSLGAMRGLQVAQISIRAGDIFDGIATDEFA